TALSTPGVVKHWYAPGNWFVEALVWIGGAFGAGEHTMDQIGRIVLMVASAGGVAWVFLTKRFTDPLVQVATAFGVTVLLSPFIHPWYVSWIVIMLAARGLVYGAEVRWLAALTCFFCWISIADKTDTP